MNRVLSAALGFAVALVVGCGGGMASAPPKAAAPPAPAIKYHNVLLGLAASAPIDLIQTVFDFSPGAASAVHIHPTPNLATVLQGQITVKTVAGDKVASAGEPLVEPLSTPVQATNPTSTETMVAGAFPVPHGGKATTAVAGQPAPSIPSKTLYTFTLDSPSITGGYRIVQEVLDFAPGSQTPRQRVGGPGIITVLQGQVTLSVDGGDKSYMAAESFSEAPGQTLQAFNRGGAEALVLEAFLLPDGAQLTTKV